MLSVGSIVRFMGGIAIHAKNIGKNTQRTIACVFVVITSNNVFPFCGGGCPNLYILYKLGL